MTPPRPHDLLRLPGASAVGADAPDWATAALSVTPWVVVRRGTAQRGRLAVGVRGATRSQRWATDINPGDVGEVLSPEELAHRTGARDLPALAALDTARPLLDDAGLRWGPTGSVGFELATGARTTTPHSDLDLLVRLPRGTQLARLTELYRRLHALAVRVDCQVDTAAGALALGELVGEQPDVLVRTPEGPRLVPREHALA
ncbi:malonate decarboxylase holo-ACP synthase [Mycolicibacterium mengxianglii]|uniref:malonate decarboxylase holo-ACP synthase n=1 Tax=Mycolicibacterium mengxianglii TaxID=2736649 RepID=UPI0018D1750C|nr:malonate decarboxylase holo-ACP synthase [Mycolicibacterium mengxianglii]